MASRLSVLAVALSDSVAEIDINPVRLMVDDCIGLDALVVPFTNVAAEPKTVEV